MGKTESIRIRVEAREREAFQKAAELSGITLSTWMRERLRRVAIKELEEAAIPVDFLINK